MLVSESVNQLASTYKIKVFNTSESETIFIHTYTHLSTCTISFCLLQTVLHPAMCCEHTEAISSYISLIKLFCLMHIHRLIFALAETYMRVSPIL